MLPVVIRAVWPLLLGLSFTVMADRGSDRSTEVPSPAAAEDARALLERARETAPADNPADLVEQAKDGADVPDDLDALMERARGMAAPAIPALDGVRERAGQQQGLGPDIGALAGQGRELRADGLPQEEPSGPAVYVFISFSMPEATLEALRDQAQRIGAPLVLRGLVDDDMARTTEAIRGLVGTDPEEAEGREIAIDPTLFRRFDIERVPTVVAAESKAPQCDDRDCPTPAFHAVGGDVTLHWALERIAGAASDELADALAPKIARLSGGKP